MSTPRVAVVIGSGGLKCLAAIALFEFLGKQGITPALLVGASGGGTLAAAAGIGLDAARMQDLAKEMVNPRLFRRFDWRAVLGALGVPFFRFEQTSGLVRPGPIRAVFRRIFGDRRLEELPIRTVLLATDLTTFEPHHAAAQAHRARDDGLEHTLARRERGPEREREERGDAAVEGRVHEHAADPGGLPVGGPAGQRAPERCPADDERGQAEPDHRIAGARREHDREHEEVAPDPAIKVQTDERMLTRHATETSSRP